MLTTNEIIIRLFLSLFLGGLVGLERESLKRPAGFRTHTLVCLGSTLIMLCGLYLYDIPYYRAALDPSRFGAQIVSGIGFLGAGTIIRENFSVKGLTTAASLWAVSGIGIATGSGFYLGAILASVFVLLALLLFSKIEEKFSLGTNQEYVVINTIGRPGQIGKITSLLGTKNIKISNIKMIEHEEHEDIISLKMTLILPRRIQVTSVLEEVMTLDGVKSANMQ